MADSNAHAQLEKFKAEPREAFLHSITARLNLRQQKAAVATVLSLPLATSLKKAIVFSATEGLIPRLHARRLLTVLGLRGV
jgi:hypothetical protein